MERQAHTQLDTGPSEDIAPDVPSEHRVVVITIELRKLCKWTMSWKKVRATEDAVYGWPNGMKWAYFENLSTTVSMTLLPCTLGSASMKSTDMSDQIREGTGMGCRRPAGVEHDVN
jgi:hypothetical protein